MNNTKKTYSQFLNTLLLFVLLASSAFAQQETKKTQINFFGHIEYDFDALPTTNNSYLSIGEQDFFITSKITDRISFLGENVIRFDGKSPSYFIPSIERVQLKFDYYKNHSFIVGKMHTPVNYWNDTYHHGRLFFPTIDRPLAFSYLVPVHTLGVRLQGQNLGDLKFGYDLVAGNGISSTDFSDTGVNTSAMAGIHIKPFDNFRIGVSYYYDFIQNNFSGAHSGHTTAAHQAFAGKYKGNINYELFSLSASYFSDRFELLNEASLNKSGSDTLGIAINISNYTYIGFRIKEKFIPFISYDFIDISNKDAHVGHFSRNKVIAGCRYEINHLMNVKVHVAQISPNHALISSHSHNNGPNSYEFKIQMAYGF
jgi:hypothetical protein